MIEKDIEHTSFSGIRPEMVKEARRLYESRKLDSRILSNEEIVEVVVPKNNRPHTSALRRFFLDALAECCRIPICLSFRK